MKLKITDEKLDELIKSNFICPPSKEIAINYKYGFRAAEHTHQPTVDKLMSIVEMQREALELQFKRSKETATWIEKHYFENDEGDGDFYVKSTEPFNELEIMREECKSVLTKLDKMLKELNQIGEK